MKDGNDPIWNTYRSKQPDAHDTPPAPPAPPDTRGVDYAAYCEGVAAQLAGNPKILTGANSTQRQVTAHALGRHDSAHHADILTLAKLAGVLDKLFAPADSSAT